MHDYIGFINISLYLCVFVKVFQGNRRIFQGYPGQRHNGGSYYDRNSNRTNYRYSGDQRHQGERSQGDASNSQFSNSMKGPAHPSVSSYRQDRPAQNGLPQRQPRTPPKNPWHTLNALHTCSGSLSFLLPSPSLPQYPSSNLYLHPVLNSLKAPFPWLLNCSIHMKNKIQVYICVVLFF